MKTFHKYYRYTIRLLFPMALCSVATLIVAQHKVSACVLDVETKARIDLVAVVSSIDNTITNSEGEFIIKVSEEDEITLSHVGYQSLSVNSQELGDTLFLQPKIYQLAEVLVVPRAVLIRELTAVWERYYKILAKKKEKGFPQQTFYYRQLTQNDELYTEYIECFFTAPTGVSLLSMFLQEGRYARVKKKSAKMFRNFFYLSQITPFLPYDAKTKSAMNGFLTKDFTKYYDIRLSRILSPDDEEEIKVYEFIPYKEKISKNAAMLSGFLYIRTKDLSIVRMEASTKYMGLRGLNAVDEKYNFIVTYRDNQDEMYPVVETVRGDAEMTCLYGKKEFKIKLYSMLYAVDYTFKTGGKKLKQQDFLLRKVADTKYNHEFWDDNPIVKRTKIEQQVVDDFNRLGYFGSMNLN